LSEAKKNLDKKDLFYVSLEKALHNFLKSKLSIETTDYSKQRISELLLEKNIGVAINKDYENAVKVISEIDKVI